MADHYAIISLEMRGILFWLFTIAVIVVIIWTVIPPSDETNEITAHKAFGLINEYRTKQGLSALSWDNTLANLAVEHSEYMSKSGNFNHSQYGFVENIFYYETRIWGIIPAGGIPSGDTVVTAWKESPGHNANLLNNDIQSGAIGIVGNYATFIAE